MNQPEGHNQGDLPIAALLRMAADGELTPELEARLRAHLDAHPGDADRVEFECKLREACACACTPDTHAPPSLRDKVLACCRAEATPGPPHADETRRRAFWARPHLARFGAIAAVLTLVAAVSFMVGRGGIDLGPVTPQVMMGRVVHFVRREHDRCADMPVHDNAKFTVEQPSGLEPEFAALAGREVSLKTILDAENHGLHFLDAGQCHLPSGGTAMHIRFTTDNPGVGVVSVWAQVGGTLDLDEGVTYAADDQSGVAVRLWRVGEVRYIMVCCTPDELPEAEDALGCPSQSLPCADL